MRLLRSLWDHIRWSQDTQFFIGSVIAFLGIAFVLLVLTGCASLTQPAIFPEEIEPSPGQREICALIYEHVRWMMARAGVCAGWVRL